MLISHGCLSLFPPYGAFSTDMIEQTHGKINRIDLVPSRRQRKKKGKHMDPRVLLLVTVLDLRNQ